MIFMFNQYLSKIYKVSFHHGIRKFLHENRARFDGDKELDER